MILHGLPRFVEEDFSVVLSVLNFECLCFSAVEPVKHPFSWCISKSEPESVDSLWNLNIFSAACRRKSLCRCLARSADVSQQRRRLGCSWESVNLGSIYMCDRVQMDTHVCFLLEVDSGPSGSSWAGLLKVGFAQIVGVSKIILEKHCSFWSILIHFDPFWPCYLGWYKLKSRQIFICTQPSIEGPLSQPNGTMDAAEVSGNPQYIEKRTTGTFLTLVNWS